MKPSLQVETQILNIDIDSDARHSHSGNSDTQTDYSDVVSCFKTIFYGIFCCGRFCLSLGKQSFHPIGSFLSVTSDCRVLCPSVGLEVKMQEAPAGGIHATQGTFSSFNSIYHCKIFGKFL